MLVHASSVAIANDAVLLAGPSGAGKSDLALRLIDAGAELIADDQTLLTVENNTLIAASPTSITGLIEVRHIGLLRLPRRASARTALYIELTPGSETLERLPEPDCITLNGINIRRLHLPSFAASTPAKIRAALLYPQEQ